MRGSDIVIARCLGADHVFVGRATLYGVVTDGRAGAATAVSILKSEIDLSLALLGCPNFTALDSSFVIRGSETGFEEWAQRFVGQPDRLVGLHQKEAKRLSVDQKAGWRTKPVLTDELASAVMRAARASAVEANAPVSIAIVDDGGLLSDSSVLTPSIRAQSKCRSQRHGVRLCFAAALRYSRRDLPRDLHSFSACLASSPSTAGVPLIFDGHTFGAIGVSGAALTSTSILQRWGRQRFSMKRVRIEPGRCHCCSGQHGASIGKRLTAKRRRGMDRHRRSQRRLARQSARRGHARRNVSRGLAR